MISSLLTALGPVPILFHCFRSISATPLVSKPRRHYLSSDEVMTEMSVAVTLTWHGVKISKWKPRNGTPRAVMFQHETRLPLMWSVFWNEDSGSFDVRLSRSFTLNGWKSISSSNGDTLVWPLDVFEGAISLNVYVVKVTANSAVADDGFQNSDCGLSSFPTLYM